jgi:hypothetical protein
MKIVTIKKCDGGAVKSLEFDSGRTSLLNMREFSELVDFIRDKMCCENCRNFVTMREGKHSYCQMLGSENCFKFFEC